MQIASKRPAPTAGFLLLLCVRRPQPGCRCQRTPPPAAARRRRRRPAATAWLAGSVVDRRAQPVPEARVLAFPLAADGGDAVRDRDRPGRPVPLRPPAAGRRIACWSRRRAFRRPRRRPCRRRRTTPPSASTAKGDRSSGGSARPGRPSRARASLLAPDGGGPMRETVTRAGGGFAFGGLGAGRYAVRAVSGDAASVARARDRGAARARPPRPSSSSCRRAAPSPGG